MTRAAVGRVDLGNLPRIWQAVDVAFDQLDKLPPSESTRDLTARRFDESQPAGPRTYIESERFLRVAQDNHRALLALLQHHGATPWAPWSLLRPSFESAFFAAWILDPEDGRQRRTRGLKCEVRDALEQRKHLQSFQRVPEFAVDVTAALQRLETGSMAAYRAEAAKLGITWNTLQQKVDVTAQLARLSAVASDPSLPAFVEATWRMLSGYEHGLCYALLRGSDRDVVAKTRGGAIVHMTINDDAFVTAAKVTAFLMITACERFIRRHTRP